MKLTRTSAAVDFRLINRFEVLRRKLADQRFADRWDKPLAYWALPNDRRLPLAFLDRSVADLLRTPFDDLYATPGVGRQKLSSLLKLLARAASETPPDAEWPGEESPADEALASAVDGPAATGFDQATVSEAVWVEWRQTVKNHGLEDVPLGRFAPTLAHLPRVLWTTPMSAYTELSLNEIRHLKTHGEKRVAALLEVFAAIHRVLGRVPADVPLSIRIEPRSVHQVSDWAQEVLGRGELPSPEEVNEQFVRPLLEQVRLDAGDQVADLAAARLGVGGSGTTVRQAARGLGLTRARVYQLLADVAEVVRLRWPAGEGFVNRLAEGLLATRELRSQYTGFQAAVELYFHPAKPGRLGPRAGIPAVRVRAGAAG